MRRFLVALALLGLGALAWAGPPHCLDCMGTAPVNLNCGPTSSPRCFYFSDCATGGTGTYDHPYCLDPLSTGFTDTYNILFDGVNAGQNPEAVAGDTIFFCAGPCDGTGSTVIRPTPINTTAAQARHADCGPHCSVASGSHNVGDACSVDPDCGIPGTCPPRHVLWVPRVCGTDSAHQITLRTFPGEDVTISGDTLGNDVFSGGADDIAQPGCDTRIPDPCPFVTIQNLKFAKVQHQFFRGMPGGNHVGFNDWTFDTVEMSGTCSQGMWDGMGLYPGGCPVNSAASNGSGYDLNVTGVTTNFLVKNSKFHDGVFAFRFVDNAAATAITVQDSEGYNLNAFSNDFHSRNITYQRNYVHDTASQGFSEENDTIGVIVQDNSYECKGDYQLISPAPPNFDPNGNGYTCVVGITDNDGDTPGDKAQQYHSKGLTIRRNKVWGDALNPSQHGLLRGGIWLTASCRSSYPVIACTHNAGDHQGTCGGGLYCDGSSGGVDGQCFPSDGWSACTYDQTNHVDGNEVWNVQANDQPDGTSQASNAGIMVSSPNAAVIANNSVYEITRTGIAALGNTAHKVANNIIGATLSGSTSWSPLLLETGFTAADLTHNVVTDESTVVGGYCSYPCTGGGDATITKAALPGLGDASNFVGIPTYAICDVIASCALLDPKPANWDLHLNATDSVARNAGENTDCPAFDIDVQARPYGALCDLGADEWLPNTVMRVIQPEIFFTPQSGGPFVPPPGGAKKCPP